MPRKNPVRRRGGHSGGIILLLILPLILLPALVVGLIAAPPLMAAYGRDLPPAGELSSQFAFRTTQILDRNGKLLYELNDKNGGKRLPVELEEISRDLIEATIATEDKDFYSNLGIDPVGIARAAYQNLTQGEVIQGGSTITQQLAKNLLIDPSERASRTFDRKLKEVGLALRISQRYTKNEIPEMYLNEVYYGHMAYGIEAAAQTYFGKSAKDLNLAEAAMLAGLPQAPSDYDPLVNLTAARDRQAAVLGRMVEEGYVTSQEADRAKAETLTFKRERQEPFEAPHFVMYVRQLLEQKYGAGTVYRQGLKVTTTLDLEKNRLAEKAIQAQMESLKKQEATNASLVAIDPKTSEIIAMVGSRDYFDESIDGEVNVATSPRQPGSTIKPIEYALAFQKGWGSQTIIVDEATNFPNTSPGLPPYRPQNFDRKYDGPMTVRYALANSKNIPAVKALMFDTIPEFVRFAGQLGIRIEQPEKYGLSLALGAAPVSLLSIAGAYAAIDNDGVYRAPVAVLKVEDSEGGVLEEYQPLNGEQVMGAEQAYMITSILSDNTARTPLQGPNSVLKLSRPAAAKTGSTDDYKDSWTIGYTPDLVAGVWVGNTDNRPMKEVVGSLGAGKIWNTFMEAAHEGQPLKDFTPPGGMREYRLCKETGQPATPECKTVITEVWPRSYTPAQYAQIPGLKEARAGWALGLTVSPQGGNLAVPPTPTPAPATATPEASPTAEAPEASPTAGAPEATPTHEPEQQAPSAEPTTTPAGPAPASQPATPTPHAPSPVPLTATPGPVPAVQPSPTPAPAQPPAQPTATSMAPSQPMPPPAETPAPPATAVPSIPTAAPVQQMAAPEPAAKPVQPTSEPESSGQGG